MSNPLYKIAENIAQRGRCMGWKPGTKTADNLNLEAWVGACMATTGQRAIMSA